MGCRYDPYADPDLADALGWEADGLEGRQVTEQEQLDRIDSKEWHERMEDEYGDMIHEKKKNSFSSAAGMKRSYSARLQRTKEAPLELRKTP